jgi:hypothetical protein
MPCEVVAVVPAGWGQAGPRGSHMLPARVAHRRRLRPRGSPTSGRTVS